MEKTYPCLNCDPSYLVLQVLIAVRICISIPNTNFTCNLREGLIVIAHFSMCVQVTKSKLMLQSGQLTDRYFEPLLYPNVHHICVDFIQCSDNSTELFSITHYDH